MTTLGRWPIIQVAGVADRAEAELLIGAGVTHLGFPLRLRDGREDLDEASAAEVVAAVGARAACVLITYQACGVEIASLAQALGVAGVQLHGPIEAGEIRQLRQHAPDLFLVPGLVVGACSEAALVRWADSVAPLVDGFITDTFDPATGRRGATGIAHDWSVSRRLVERLPRPVVLAGGLTPDNVEAAIAAVGPAGVDAHTGLEGPDGRKAADRVGTFVARARATLGLLESRPLSMSGEHA